MLLKLIVFDIAGTTIIDKNYVASAFRNAFANHDIGIYEKEINPLMGYEKRQAIQIMLEKNNNGIDGQLIEAIYQDFINEMIDFYQYSSLVTPMPGAEKLFQNLKDRAITVTLNTGFPKKIADVIVKRFRWKERGLIDDYIASDEVKLGRPHPFMIEELMRRAGIDDPSQVAKVGDTTVDIEEGKNAECRYIISVTTDDDKTRELENHHPTHIVSNLFEINSILS